MASSRIFVRGLPPHMSEDHFRKHFAAQPTVTVTDARLIPRRRIGYVGYKSSADAVAAVKYFNKSFIGMARIYVEIARPIRHEAADVEGETQRAVESRDFVKAEGPARQDPPKRKRGLDEDITHDRKLREFLHVMQGSSKSNIWADRDVEDVEATLAEGGADKVTSDAISIVTDARSIAMPSHTARPSNQEKTADVEKPQPIPANSVPMRKIADGSMLELSRQDTGENDQATESHQRSAVSDHEWRRTRTSRLLGLVDEEDEHLQTPLTTSLVVMDEPRAGLQPIVESQPPIPENHPTASGITRIDSNLEQSSDTPAADNGRLFIRNLSYTATADDLRDCFSPYGELVEVHVPTTAEGVTKGIAYITYLDARDAARASKQLDRSILQGRLMHIIPAAAKVERKLSDFAISQLPLKKQKALKRKAEAASAVFNWNAMYMNADAVMASISDRLKMAKSDLLDPTSSDAAVNQAHAETHVIQETKRYFTTNGVDLNAFQRQDRGDTAILVKNFPYGTSAGELKTMFEEYGQLSRLLMPPAGTVAIVEFMKPSQARAAFTNLAYRRLKNSVLFLEKAPKGLFRTTGTGLKMEDGQSKVVEAKRSTTDVLPIDGDQDTVDTSSLYIRNLNFSTDTACLRERCQSLQGFMSALVKTRSDPKRPGQTLSMGYGFVEFRTVAQAQAAARTLDGYQLDGHRLQIRPTRKHLDAAEATKEADRSRKASGKRTKIIIKNLPFEASKKDIRSLFGAYGQLRSVRLPKKFDHSTRGFAFADFVTAREAENAINALKDTHLLGRRLVLDFAAEDPVDAEDEIQKMQEKVERQTQRVAVQRLVVSNRQKFAVGGEEDPEEAL